MNQQLYDILFNNQYYTHSIGKVSDKNTMMKFNSIIELNGFYSKAILRKKGIKVEGKVSGNIRITNDSYISLFDPTISQIAKQLLSPNFRRYGFHFDTDEIFFLIDSSIEYELDAQRHRNDYKEIIVKDHLPLGFCRGIIIPNDPQLLKAIEDTLEHHNIDLPIYDFEGNLISLEKRTRG